jgi:hypothetical protein
MRKIFTEGLVRLTTTDIFKPYGKLETPQWNLWRWSGSRWGRLFNRGIEGRINTRSRRVPINREEEK